MELRPFQKPPYTWDGLVPMTGDERKDMEAQTTNWPITRGYGQADGQNYAAGQQWSDGAV